VDIPVLRFNCREESSFVVQLAEGYDAENAQFVGAEVRYNEELAMIIPPSSRKLLRGLLVTSRLLVGEDPNKTKLTAAGAMEVK
jgi:hypothetical protein